MPKKSHKVEPRSPRMLKTLRCRYRSLSSKFPTHRSDAISVMKTGTTVKIPPAAVPARNRKIINSNALSAKYNKIQPRICGKAIRKIEFFLPISLAAKPNISVPESAPIVRIEPIIEASSFVIFPHPSGVSSDCNSGTAALVQPVASP